MALSHDVVDAALRWQAEGLPPAVRGKTLLHIADTLGIAAAASRLSPIAAQVREGLGLAGGPWPPVSRAFVTSACAHTLDYDDIHDLARVHPSSVTLPAALAAARLSQASGRELVLATAVANELLCRLGLAWLPRGSGPGAGWFLSQLFGYFAAALAAGLVLRLPREALVSALGLAYMQAAGGKQAGFGTGANARAIYTAFAAAGGVQAALLARAGISGPAEALDGDAGFFPLYFGRALDDDQARTLLDGPLHAWMDTQVKLWPCCRHAHPYVFAASVLRARCAGRAIARVEVHANRSAARLCLPLAGRRRPDTLQDAKYSIPFIVAYTLVHGEPALDGFDERVLRDEAVLAMAQRVEVVQTGSDETGLPRAVLQARLDAGGPVEVDDPFAVPQTPAVLRDKFVRCLVLAGHTQAATAAAWERLMALDDAQPADTLHALLLDADRPA